MPRMSSRMMRLNSDFFQVTFISDQESMDLHDQSLAPVSRSRRGGTVLFAQARIKFSNLEFHVRQCT